jgi:hypothetical protein
MTGVFWGGVRSLFEGMGPLGAVGVFRAGLGGGPAYRVGGQWRAYLARRPVGCGFGRRG